MTVERGDGAVTARPFLSIAQIDAVACDESATACAFGQALPARCDLVLWDLGSTAQQVARDVEGAALARVLPPTASNRLAHRTREARAAIAAALQRGALVVVLVSDQPSFVLHTLEEPVPLSLLEVLPGEPVVPAALAPHDRRTGIVDAGAPFAAFFAETRQLFAPAWSLPGGVGMPVAHVGHACVARFDQRHPGGVLLLPALRADAGAQGQRTLVDALSRLVVSLRNEHAPVLLAHGLAAPQVLQDSWQDQAQIESESQRLQERREAAAARTRQQELGWSLCAGEPSWALSNFAQACASAGWQEERITVGKGAVVLSRPGLAVTLIAIGVCADNALEVLADAERLHAQVEDELAVMSAPCLLVYLADNHLPPTDRPGIPAALQAACDQRQRTILTSDALYRAWAQGALATLVATATQHPFPRTRTTA